MRRILNALQQAWAVLFAASHSGRRWRSVILAAGAAGFDRAVSAVCTFIQIPLVLHYLGAEAFGLWMTLNALVNAMFFADLGLGIGLQNKISEAFGKEDLRHAERIFSSGFILLSALSLTLCLGFLPLCWWINWADLFHILDPETRAQTASALALLGSSFFIGLPLVAANRLCAALQLSWLIHLKNVGSSLVSLICLGLAVWGKLSLLGFLAVAVGPPLAANLLLCAHLFRRFQWSWKLWNHFDATLGKSLVGKHWLVIFPQIGGTLLGTAPALIVSSTLGAAATTPFVLLQRLLGFLGQPQQMILNPLWPAYTEARARGELDWIRAAYRRSLWISLAIAVIPILSFAFWGRPFATFWSGQPTAAFSPLLIGSLSTWTALAAFSQAPAFLLNAMGQFKGQATYGLLAVLLSLAAMPWAVQHWGAAGVPLCLLAIFGSTALPLILWEAATYLRQLPHLPSPQSSTL